MPCLINTDHLCDNSKLTVEQFYNSDNSLLKYLQAIPDYRVNKHLIVHELADVLLQIILSFLSNNLSLRSSFTFGKNQFKKFPSTSTIQRIINKIDITNLSSCLKSWFKDLCQTLNLTYSHIAIDGKKLLNYSKCNWQSPKQDIISLVSAFCTDLKITVDSVFSNNQEQGAFRELINNSELYSYLVTGDCLHLNKESLELLQSKKLNYILGIKNNSPHLLKQLQAQSVPVTTLTVNKPTVNKPKLSKTITVYQVPALLKVGQRWSQVKIKTFIKIETTDLKKRKRSETQASRRDYKKPKSTQTNYYISNLSPDLKPLEFAQLIRSHWQVENALHRERDTVFREDSLKTSSQNQVKITAIILTFVMNVLYLNKFATMTEAVRRLSNRIDLCLPMLSF